MKQTFEINILNQKFVFKSDNDEKAVKKVADYVNKKMNEIVVSNKAISTANVAILTALNIADDFFKTKKEQSEMIEKWSQSLENLKSKLP